MELFVFFVVLIALLAAFCIRLMGKWGIREWVQIHGGSFFGRMFDCDFCLSFWTGCVLSFFCVILTGHVDLFAIPFFSTVITLRFV